MSDDLVGVPAQLADLAGQWLGVGTGLIGPPEPDVDYGGFVADPVGTVESVYAHFGLTLSGPAADAMRALHRRGAGRPGHQYSLSDFGLTGQQVDERFAGVTHRA